MNDSSAPFVKRRTAIIGWLTIFTQAALPLSLAYTPIALAAQQKESEQPKWYQSGNNGLNNQAPFSQNGDQLAAAGSALSQSNSAAAAAGMARSAATGAVNNSVEEWLGQFGTARVQLNLDDKFKANGSEADLLVPLYDKDDVLLFTQLGFRHIDSRNTGNLGVGARTMTGDWMLGVNTFFDNDFSGNNRRMGMGVEAWRDYLKLSANGYMRLSDWHQSRDFADYDERPANGYDIRAEGWLPAFPQLGAKVMFEQYQGNEVALFGKDNRQKDPWAFTGGVNYTPVPLVTIGAQHRAGKAGQNDSQVILQMNYRLGESWDKQLDPNLIGASRPLAGTRYDLVERNNSIVLDYRKQETVTLTLPEKTLGKSRSTVPVSFTVKTKNPLQRIDWDAATLVAAGGSLTQVGSNQLSVVLPAYQAAGSNVYRFAGVAYDTKGNSGNATAEIHVQVGDVNASGTKISTSANNLIANGADTSIFKIELFDNDNNPVSGMEKSLKASISETLTATQPAAKSAVQAATIGPIVEALPGVYQALVTAGTRVGSIVISSQFNDSALPDTTITESADATSGHIAAGAIVAAVDSSLANNTTANQVNVTITDAGNNPLANTAVTFTLSGSATVAVGSSLNAVTDDQGQVALSFVDKIAEAVTVNATLGNGNSGSVITHFLADSSTATLNNGDISADKTSAIANNSDIVTYSAVVKDANGNVVPNVSVNWATDKGTLTGNSSATDSNGLATITLKNSVTGPAQVSAQVGNSGNINAPVVNFTADDASATIGSDNLTVDKTTVIANNTDMATYTAIVKDSGGNVVPNIAVNWATDLGTLSATDSTTDSNGQATITLKGISAGTARVSASVNGAAAVNANSVTFIADSSSASIANGDVTVDKMSVVANNVDIATHTAIVKDANGNTVPNVTVNWTTSKGTLSAGSTTTDNSGKATITLKDTLVGPAQVSAQAGTSGNINAPMVDFTPDNASATISNGDVNVDKTIVVADNTDLATYSAIVKDANGNLVPNVTVNWATNKGTLSSGSSTTDSNGMAIITLKDTQVGQAQVTAQAGHSANINAPAIDFIANSGSATIGSGDLTVDKTSLVANNTEAATYTVIVKDANGNVVPNLAVSWTTNLGTLSAPNTTTDAHGQATVMLKGTLVGMAQVAAAVNGNAPTNAPQIALIADSTSASIDSGDLSVDKTTVVANNADMATYTAIVKDANRNVVPNTPVNWTTDKGALSSGTSTTDVNGKATITLKDTATGNAQVTAQTGSSANVNASIVNFIADSASATISGGDLTVDKTSIVANNTEIATYTAIVKDANGNVVPNLGVNWVTNLGTISASSTSTDIDGKATITLKGTLVGTAVITASVNGTAPVNANAVTLTADSTTASIGTGDLTVDKTTVVANNTDIATYTALVKDANGNPVPNFSVSWTTTHGTLPAASSNTDAAGHATITLKGTLIGTAQVVATANGGSVNASLVTLIADATTAQVTSVTSNLAKITGTGDDSAIQTAIVKDANGNVVPNQTVTWSTSMGSMSNTTTQTDSNGETTSTLSNIVLTSASNGTATVTAAAPAGSRTGNVIVRTVLLAGGKYYWTMTSDHNTSVLATAQANCANYGGGRVFNESDISIFIGAGGDYQSKSVSGGEFSNNWFRLGDKWTTKSVDLFNNAGSGGATNPAAGVEYTCVK